MVGVVVALVDGIYLVQQEVGSLLRARRLTDGRVCCLSKSGFKHLVAARRVYVISRRPGRFADMPLEALVALHQRLRFSEEA